MSWVFRKSYLHRILNKYERQTVYAGEAASSASIWQAINELGAERIGHGVAAVQDSALLDYLAEYEIGIEACLTSNLLTNTVADLTEHPIHRFLAKGIKVCLNTDDPAVQGIELRHEYHNAAHKAGLTVQQRHQYQRHALEMAFLSSTEKAALSAKFNQKLTISGSDFYWRVPVPSGKAVKTDPDFRQDDSEVK